MKTPYEILDKEIEFASLNIKSNDYENVIDAMEQYAKQWQSGQSSQPQPNAISVIEAYRDQLQESSKYFELDDWDDQSNIIKAQINLLETILNQVK